MRFKFLALTGAILFPLLLWQWIGLFQVAHAVQPKSVDVCPDKNCDYSTINEAVGDVPIGSIINLPPGTYSENLVITKSLTIQGQQPDLTLLDGGGLAVVIVVDDLAAVTIRALTIQNGRSSEGGGILNIDGTLAINNSIIQDNDVGCGEGGGILNYGVMTLQDVTLSGNQAAYGGGILNGGLLLGTNITVTYNSAVDDFCEGLTGYGGGIDNSGTLSLTAASLEGNTAVRDGGAVENAGIFTATLSLFTDNQAQARGGGLDNVAGGQAAIRQSTFRLNAADLGGGVNNEGVLDLVESVVHDNTAVLTANSGGGLRNEIGGTLTVVNSTISGNQANEGGGLLNEGAGATAVFRSSTVANNFGISYGGLYNRTGSVVLHNTIVAGQGNGRDCGGGITIEGSNLDSDGSCTLGAGNFSRVSQPFLGPLQNNSGPTWTHALLIGSPAIDASPVCEPTDQRGVSRPVGSACDIGAYETFAYKIYLPATLR